MEVGRRDLLKLLAVGATAGLTPRQVEADPSAPDRLLEFPPLGNLTLLHLTDSHATLRPVFFREPDTRKNTGRSVACESVRCSSVRLPSGGNSSSRSGAEGSAST